MADILTSVYLLLFSLFFSDFMSLRRYLAFARRFLPLWMVWLLVALIPVSREVARLHIVGSPLVRLYDQPWRQSFGRGSEFNGFTEAKDKPRDLNAQLWRFSLQTQGWRAIEKDEIGDSYFNPNYTAQTYSPPQLLREAQAIERAFSNEKWLRALPVRVVLQRMEQWADEKPNEKPDVPQPNAAPSNGPVPASPPNKPMSDKRTRRLVLLVQNAAKFEPDNAYYALVEAEIWRRNRNSNLMWRALNRAAKCKRFETHGLEVARAVVAAHEAIRPLSLEEKYEVWQDNNGANNGAFDHWAGFLGQEGRLARKDANHRRVIAVAAILASVGDLMQRGTNSRQVAIIGDSWKSQAWSLTPNPKLKGRALSLGQSRRAQNFAAYAAYAASHGRRDVAALVPKWAARQRELRILNGGFDSDYSYSGFDQNLAQSNRGELARAAIWRDVGVVVLLHGGFVAGFWFLVNLFLWRGSGAPSVRRDRIIPALLIFLSVAALALWTWRQVQIYDAATMVNRWNRAVEMQQIAIGSVGVLAFFGAPFLLAVLCAAATMLSQRLHFLQKPRIETELRLGAGDALLLKSGPTILCAVSLLSAFGFWVLWLTFVALDIRTFDPLSWMPLDRKGNGLGFSMPTEVLLAPLMYCLFLSFIGFILWFLKWRYYYGGQENRALTHGGLRRWKESLGIYLVMVSALYLSMALASFPARSAASRELALHMARGELAP